jgi:hypothetical protein
MDGCTGKRKRQTSQSGIFKTTTQPRRRHTIPCAPLHDTGIHLSSIQRIAAASKNRGQPVRGIHRETEIAYTVTYE